MTVFTCIAVALGAWGLLTGAWRAWDDRHAIARGFRAAWRRTRRAPARLARAVLRRLIGARPRPNRHRRLGGSRA